MSSKGEHILSKIFDIDPMVTTLLKKRGVRSSKEISDFLFPNFSQLHDPFLLNDMKPALTRLAKAIKKNEKIVIYGDYDCDGITATSILCKLFKDFHANFDYVIPFRKDGYGITAEAVTRIKNDLRADLIITVDNGSNAHEAMRKARALNLEIIVTDHHQITDGFPDCLAFINPTRDDSTYPFSYLSGAGVALKVAQGLYMRTKANWKKRIWKLIEFAAAGTIADVMPLVGENRVLSYFGVAKMNQNPSIGFDIIKRKLQLHEISSSTIAFKIAPLLNASGRIGDPNIAVSFLTNDAAQAKELIEVLFDWNEYRKTLTLEQMQKAEEKIRTQDLLNAEVLIVSGSFHEGIIGILAARLCEKYEKPTIVICEETGKGSARNSVNNRYSITDLIATSQKELESFGGHHGAAGLTVKENHFFTFYENIQKQYRKQIEKESQPIETQTVIKEYDFLIPIEQFSHSVFRDFHLLEPYGESNEKPVFFSPNTHIASVSYFGKENVHAKILFGQKQAFCFFTEPIQEHSCYDLYYTILDDKNFLIQKMFLSNAKSLSS